MLTRLDHFTFIKVHKKNNNVNRAELGLRSTKNNTPLIFNRLMEDISLQQFIAPSFDFLLCLSVCLSFYPNWLALLPSLGCASGCQTSNQTGKKERQTERAKSQRREQ